MLSILFAQDCGGEVLHSRGVPTVARKGCCPMETSLVGYNQATFAMGLGFEGLDRIALACQVV